MITGTNVVEKREAAADGIVAIHKSYSDAVDELVEAGLNEKALWLACEGLSTPLDMNDAPNWHELVADFEALWPMVKDGPPGPIEASCTSMNVPDSWGEARHLRSPYD